MNITLMIYLIGISSNVFTTIILMAVAVSICNGIYIGAYLSEFAKIPPHFKKLIFIPVLLFTLASMIPDKSTLYMMAGSEISKEILANPKVEETLGKLLKVVNTKLDEQIPKTIEKETK